MLRTIVRLEKLAALRRRFWHQGMLVGSTAGSIAQSFREANDLDDIGDVSMNDVKSDSMDNADGEQDPGTEDQEAGKEQLHDAVPVDRPRALSSIVLAETPGMFWTLFLLVYSGTDCHL